jgi:hypothetical protein
MSVPGCAEPPIAVPAAISMPLAEAAPPHRHRHLPPMPVPYYGEGGPGDFELEEDDKLSEIQARLGALDDRLAMRQKTLEKSTRND